jgi:hypothetical protein
MICSYSGIVLIITGCLTQPYSTLILTARWCDIVVNVQATGQEVTKIQKEYHRKQIASLKCYSVFSDGCTELLKTDMGEGRVISRIKGTYVATNPVLLTNQPNNPLVIPFIIVVSKSLQQTPYSQRNSFFTAKQKFLLQQLTELSIT